MRNNIHNILQWKTQRDGLKWAAHWTARWKPDFRGDHRVYQGKNVSAGHLFVSQLCLLSTRLLPIYLVVLEKCGIKIVDAWHRTAAISTEGQSLGRITVNPSEVRVGHVFNGLCPLSYPFFSQSSTLSLQKTSPELSVLMAGRLEMEARRRGRRNI